MTKAQVKAAHTYFPNTDEVDVEQGDTTLTNSQSDMLLTDPEDTKSGRTHGADKVVAKAKTKVKADAGAAQSLNVPDDVEPGNLHNNEELPMIDNAVTADADFDDFSEDELNLASVEDDEEFGDMVAEAADGDEEFDDMEPLEPALFDDSMDGESEEALEDAGADQDVVADFENAVDSDDQIPLVDLDEVPDSSVDDVVFATVGNAVHVLRSNRIIASMGPAAAKRAEVAPVYLMPQFQDVVASALAKKGLRKGLVQAGFQLAKVKVTAKATAKVVQAKVQTAVHARMESLHQRDAVMEQALAISATGINKQFFKDVPNELKAHLEAELEQLGVRGAGRVVRAMFAQHGVSYAKSILTTAKRIAAMPDAVRENLIAALDMTDGACDDELEADLEIEEDDDGMEELPATVTAALSRPVAGRRVAALLQATQSSTAHAILSGAKSLI